MRAEHTQHAFATPFPRQTLLIVHIARPPDASLPLMSEWNAMFTYLLSTLIAVAPPGPAVPNLPLNWGTRKGLRSAHASSYDLRGLCLRCEERRVWRMDLLEGPHRAPGDGVRDVILEAVVAVRREEQVEPCPHPKLRSQRQPSQPSIQKKQNEKNTHIHPSRSSTAPRRARHRSGRS